uniref:Uncharacterized protein n=2 Tax=Chenopodium quinoa TaxID=63459 RepID=A0A803KVB7_CHEQI
MYVTRLLSLYRKSPEALAQPPPEGPNSGYLVLQDEDSTSTTCFGLCNNSFTTNLPFPQNKSPIIQHKSDKNTTNYPLFLIPVINQPLSSHQYYAIKNEGNHKGEAYTSSTEDNRQTSCFCISNIRDKKTKELNPIDKKQQFEFSFTTKCGNSMFRVKSVASYCHPPTFMRNGGWRLWNSDQKNFTLGVADGLNYALRARLPDFNFLPSEECSKVLLVGEWYTPFMFVKERTPKEQVKRSMFYEVKLEQIWKRIYYHKNNGTEGNIVSFNVTIPTQRVKVNGKEAVEISNETNDRASAGVQWFRVIDNYNGDGSRIGLSSLIVERMMWEQERVGWSNNTEKQANIARVEEYRTYDGTYKMFACYMLVERFVFKRMDGSIALSFDFNHTHQLRIKWVDVWTIFDK